jgi:hypothetical protein
MSQTQTGLAFIADQAAIIGAGTPNEPSFGEPTPAHIALSNLCHALLMSNKFLYVE